MPAFPPFHGNSGLQKAKNTRNSWGDPYILSYHPPLPPPVALCPRPRYSSRHGGRGVRGTDAAALYFIILIRTGTTNKTGRCAKKKKAPGCATAGSHNFNTMCLTCKLWLIWSCCHSQPSLKRLILKTMPGWHLLSLFILCMCIIYCKPTDWEQD